MTTGSALPSTGGTRAGNCQPSKDLGSYDPLPASLSVPRRCGSAPPSMEGSSARLDHLISQQIGSLEATLRNLGCVPDNSKSEERLHSDPSYFKYYNSKVNLNPRLLVSRESCHLMNRFGKAGEWRPSPLDYSSSSSSKFSTHCSTLSTHNQEPEDDRSPRLDSSSTEDARCGSGRSTSNLGSHRSNLVNLIQENFPRGTVLYDNCSDPSDTNSSNGGIFSGINSSKNSPLDIVKSSDLNGFPPDTQQWSPKPVASPLRNTPGSSTPASSPPSTSSSSDHSTIMQASQHGTSSTNIKPNGAVGAMLNGVDSSMKNLKISLDTQGSAHAMQQGQNNTLPQNDPSHLVYGNIQLSPQLGMATPFYTQNSFGSPYCQNLQLASVLAPPLGIDGYGLRGSFLPPFVTNFAPQYPVMTPFDNLFAPSCSGSLASFPSTTNFATGTEILNPCKIYEQLGVAMPPPVPELSFLHYFQQPCMHHYGVGNPYDTVTSSANFVDNSAAIFGSQKVLSETIQQSEQRFQFPDNGASSSSTNKKGGNYAGNHQSTSAYSSMPMPYPISPVFHGQPSSGTYPRDRRNDAPECQSLSEASAASPGTQRRQGMAKPDPKARSSVEEVKPNRTRRVELSDIKGRIVECSFDQNGSRFIQQKLENCTAEEKALVFAEIIDDALSMMTDVFGNYVIQKFFEQGNLEQRRDLAKKIAGSVKTLSLQMFGCRVFQKALETIELDQKIDLVRELDGHVLECVRDSNGNHVIQKCIECVPVEHTVFVISAVQGQVVSLSKHQFGCRVIQRILEHYSNDSEVIIDEILQSACILAQDEYGNYVAQHVLEKGKAHERSEIIGRLAGQVVSMSQNKFASNVIEKCFEHGDVAERDLLIKEILKQTEGNNSLLVMMKDKYANFVFQKILETCNNQQREALVGRMKCHLEVLRKYTYGRHIAHRIELLSGDDAGILGKPLDERLPSSYQKECRPPWVGPVSGEGTK